MKFYIFLVIFAFAKVATSQTHASLNSKDQMLIEQAQKYQDSLSEVYQNPATSILSAKQLKDFHGLEFYPIDLKFRVSATFTKTPDAIPFDMALSSGRTREYVMYGIAKFEIEGKVFTLPIYQNTYYRDHPEHEYGQSLFLPFTDYTSGNGSYGGGRYIDMEQAAIVGNTLIIDFNKNYNPYCAYTTGYNCPIPPEENDLMIRIEAGVKDFEMQE
ncbi:DUF1684 domain-containing protein [uncultured Dokdonia sp.]|uniref:DUF1684 domain-containing protein n=1 Tax=uncultured Dokdonia sp. TaxID=575653 RepID=UPI00261C581A|nr:DUF1684 domain-containing protein [uncultured Dokdonia sp.]